MTRLLINGVKVMNLFSIPADFNKNTLPKIALLNETYTPKARIHEVYGQISINNHFGTGRANDLLPKVDRARLKDYIASLKQLGIKYNYTLNATCLSNREFDKNASKELLDLLEFLHEAGVDIVTVGLPSIMELIKENGFSFSIKTSTVCQVNNVNKALAYKRLGAQSIVLDESINRDFETLMAINQACGEELELIVNVICHKNCIYENFHHNQTSHDCDCNNDKKSVQYYSYKCMLQRVEKPENLLKLAWIRPEDLHYYVAMGYKRFKIQGRQAATHGDVLKAAEMYMMESYHGNLMILLDCFMPTNSFTVDFDNDKLSDFLKPFAEKRFVCKNNCESCNYCFKYMCKHFDIDKINEIFSLAKEFYSDISLSTLPHVQSNTKNAIPCCRSQTT